MNITARLLAATVGVVLCFGVPAARGQTNYFYVRGDTLGNDGHAGTSWATAFATLQKAMNAADAFYPNGTCVINVQASAGSQSYVPCSKVWSSGGGPGGFMTYDFQGGWQNVDTTPAQTGLLAIRDPAANNIGIYLEGGYHGFQKTLTVNRFAISAVTQGIVLTMNSGSIDGGRIFLTVSNTTIQAKTYGIYMNYPKWYNLSYVGGPCSVIAENVDIVAGLGGTGDGIYNRGAWLGSSIRGSGVDPVTGVPRVSAVSSAGGYGVRFDSTAWDATPYTVSFSNALVYGCASNGISLNAAGPIYYDDGHGNISSNAFPVAPSLLHCTIADNGGDGLYAMAWYGSSARVTNSLFANNGGHGLNLDGRNHAGAFTCSEGYNDLFNDDIVTNGVVRPLAASDVTADPGFLARHGKPAKYYYLRFTDSPCYRSGSDGSNRGAYQNRPGIKGTTVFLR